MPKTSLQVVDSVIDLLQMTEGATKSYRKGYTSDVDQEPTPVLPRVNEYLSVASLTGIRAEDVNISAVPNIREYAFSSGVARVSGVYFDGIPLRQTTRNAMDDYEPMWLHLFGVPTRYWREGNKIVLDKKPEISAQIVIRAALILNLFPATDNTFMLDPAIPDTAAERIHYGAAFLQGVVDAENPYQDKRILWYRDMGNRVLQELRDATDYEDFAAPISLDDWVSRKQGPLPAHERWMDLGMVGPEQ